MDFGISVCRAALWTWGAEVVGKGGFAILAQLDVEFLSIILDFGFEANAAGGLEVEDWVGPVSDFMPVSAGASFVAESAASPADGAKRVVAGAVSSAAQAGIGSDSEA